MQSLLVLGRQPALGLAEVESLYGAEKVRAIGEHAAMVDVDPCLLAFERLGGSVKFCKVLTTLDMVSWKEIEKFLLQVGPGHSETMEEGKMYLGLSLYGFKESIKQIEATGLSLKKAIRATGRPVRLIPNKAPELNTAQVLHNGLTGVHGWELVFVRKGDQTVVAQTVKIQDIEAYAARDQERPKRDSKVGMLPPKLAQIIINLAVGVLPEEKLTSICDVPADQVIPLPYLEQTILDPFCGTGVVLQEGLLMGYDVLGTDLEPRMVEYSNANVLEWFKNEKHPELEASVAVAPGDATDAIWEDSPWQGDRDPGGELQIDFVAGETYLGRAFSAKPAPEVLNQAASDCNLIIKKFLKNIHDQLNPGTRLCLAVPAWQIRPNQFKHLPLIDSLSDLGYNRVSFEHVRDEDLLYYRKDQVVARQLLVLTRQ